ncbi:MAG TPA: hypothetical protein VFQ25_02575 [Ktedonobacterales bacterium]|nr:hypothetical protein [Ktedonobacterales bacterium]
MTSTGGFDAAVQIRRSLLENVLLRLMSDPSVSPHIPAQERIGALSFWWESPRLSFQDGNILDLAIDMRAGYRESASGRIFTLRGPVRVLLTPHVTAATAATMTMAASGPALSLPLTTLGSHHGVDVSGLQASYAGITPPPPEISGHITDEIQSLEGQFASIIRSQLNALHEVVPPVALPYSIVGVHGQSTLSVASVGVRVFGPAAGDAIAVGASLTGGGGAETAMTDMLAAHPASNVGVTVLDSAINRTIADVLGAGLVFMNADHTLRLARLQQLALSFRSGVIQATGRIVPPSSGNSAGELILTDFAGAYFSVGLRPSIPVPGQLVLTPGDANIQLDAAPRIAADTVAEATGDLVSALSFGLVPPGVGALASEITQSAVVPAELTAALHDPANWSQIMSAVFGGAYHAPTGSGFGFVDVTQHVPVPGTAIALDLIPNAVVVGDGELSLFAAVPQPNAFFQPHPPDQRPDVTINQPDIPTQETELATVTATVHAEVTTPSYDPYDFTWTTDLAPHTRSYGPDLTVTGRPRGAGPGGDLEIITNAHVTVIDGFGQIQNHMDPVYANAARRRVSAPGRLAVPLGQSSGGSRGAGSRFILPLVLLLLLALGAVSAYGAYNTGAFAGLVSGSSPTPTASAAPTTAATVTAAPTAASTASAAPTTTTTAAPTATSLPAGSPPVFAFHATPASVSQACVGIQALPSFTVTLDNTHSTMAVSWQVKTDDNAPDGAHYWAHPSASGQPGSPSVPLLTGTVAAGASKVVTITPYNDPSNTLCYQLQAGPGDTVTYHVKVQTTSGGSYSATIPDTIARPIPG